MRAMIFLMVLLLGVPAWADSVQWGTAPNSSNGQLLPLGEARIVSPERAGYHELYFHFDTTTTSSSMLIVDSPSVLFCLNPADDSTGADTAQVWINKVIGNALSDDDNRYNSVRITDAVLTGAGGAEGTQAACVRAGPGKYWVDVVAGSNSGEEAYVVSTAEE